MKLATSFARAALAAFVGLSIGSIAPVAHATQPPVYVVVFTHIEDNLPGGPLGSVTSRDSYVNLRDRLVGMAELAQGSGVQWVLQPDWKMLEAALLYTEPAVVTPTGGKNLLRYLKEDLGAVIDPHSHENGGYNYTDVAHLLDSLGVGATTVIGGHVWDPTMDQFQEWDRFRVPVSGQQYPGASWRGDILIGAGTPGHLNDPLVSGVWYPRDRHHFFEHDPAGNIVAVGGWKRTIASIGELITLYRTGAVPHNVMLTFSCNIGPSALAGPTGLAMVADTVIAPIVAWRDSGLVETTDFTSLVALWESEFDGRAYVYDADVGGAIVGIPDRVAPDPSLVTLAPVVPNPVGEFARLHYWLARDANVRLTIHDVRGRQVARIAAGPHVAGEHVASLATHTLPVGVYLCRLSISGAVQSIAERKLVVAR